MPRCVSGNAGRSEPKGPTHSIRDRPQWRRQWSSGRDRCRRSRAKPPHRTSSAVTGRNVPPGPLVSGSTKVLSAIGCHEPILRRPPGRSGILPCPRTCRRRLRRTPTVVCERRRCVLGPSPRRRTGPRGVRTHSFSYRDSRRCRPRLLQRKTRFHAQHDWLKALKKRATGRRRVAYAARLSFCPLLSRLPTRAGAHTPSAPRTSPTPGTGSVGAGAGGRTLTPSRAADFKSAASANFATPARPKG